MCTIHSDKLTPLLEPHFHKNIKNREYEVKTVEADILLTWNRLDIAFKLIFLEFLDKNAQFSLDIYEEHIKAFTLGSFSEPENENKSTIEAFQKEFKKTFFSMKENGFDSSQTLIPVSENQSIANGAHRVASAIYLKTQVDYLVLDTDDHIYDYSFFAGRGVSSQSLDFAVTKFIEYSSNTFIALIWPSAQGCDKEISSIIPNIIYQRKVDLNFNGAHNLISQIYSKEEWLGTVQDNFKGAKIKLMECFKNFSSLRVIAFQENNIERVLKVKAKIRDLFHIGKHSIHITDTKQEALRASRLLFNENSIHFLNNGKPNNYISTHTKISQFKELISDNKQEKKNFVLDSSVILSVYGLRECADVDYLSYANISDDLEGFDSHDDQLKYHENQKVDLIFNPKYFFYFEDLKFISFSQLYRMKKRRGESKDKHDCQMMEACVENKVLKKTFAQYKQKFLYFKVKFRVSMISFLSFLGIKKHIKSMVRFLGL